MTDEEKNSMELDIEAKYVGRTEKEFLNNITYAECLYILDTKNEYCDDIKNLSLLKIVDIVNEQSKEIEELKEENKKLTDEYLVQRDLINPDFLKDYINKDKIKAKIEEYEQDVKDFEEYWSKDTRKFKKEKSVDYYKLEALKELLEKE